MNLVGVGMFPPKIDPFRHSAMYYNYCVYVACLFIFSDNDVTPIFLRIYFSPNIFSLSSRVNIFFRLIASSLVVIVIVPFLLIEMNEIVGERPINTHYHNIGQSRLCSPAIATRKLIFSVLDRIADSPLAVLK